MKQRPLRGIRLRDVLPEAEFVGSDDLRITSCCSDSRRVKPGDLFVALRGAEHDGHDHVAEAVARGAVGVLATQQVPGQTLPVCVVRNAHDAFGRVCQALQGDPSRRVKVVGVTGTNGKTTTSHLIAGVLEAAGFTVGVLGTLGYYDGQTREPSPLTTPTAPVLARWLARSEAAGCSHAVMEVSSHALCQSRVGGLTFDVACVTNVRRDHLDYHGDAEAYREAKGEIFRLLRPEGVAVLNADDPGAAGFISHIDTPALTVGIRAAAEITATVLDQSISEQTFLLSAGSETVPVRTHLLATHNVYNCLVAAAVGLAYGIELSVIVRGLESVQSVPGRLERIECGQPFGVFVDYAHTADALAGCLESLRPLIRRRVFCVFGAGGDRDRLKRPVMGNVVSQLADVTVVTNDNPRTEDPHEIIGDVMRGVVERSKTHVIPDRASAIAWALSQAQAGDCVLVAGKGHEDYQIIGHERLPFDDRECVREWLYENYTPERFSKAG